MGLVGTLHQISTTELQWIMWALGTAFPLLQACKPGEPMVSAGMAGPLASVSCLCLSVLAGLLPAPITS